MQNVDQLHAYDCYQVTEYHKKYHRNCESGLAKACCTQAGPSHFARHLEMACTTSNPHCCSQKRSESSDRNHESGNKDKRHRQIAMRLPQSL